MKLWLDDERPMPEDFDLHVKTARGAIQVLEFSPYIDEVSLDHDLGDLDDCGDGYEVACWIEERAARGLLRQLKWSVHSANPAGASKMRAALESADRAWRHGRQS